MGFSISNLTIIVITVIVVFCNESLQVFDWKKLSVYDGPEERKGSEVCIEDLENGGYRLDYSGFKNFQARVSNVCEEVKYRGTDLKNYKEIIKQKINEKYKFYYTGEWYSDESRSKAYFCHLATHALNPKRMLTVQTWCEIHGNGTYDAYEFLSQNSNLYRQYFRRIAKDTGLSRKKQTLVYRTMDVCHGETTKQLKESYFLPKYNDMQNDNKNNFKPIAINWCAINVCYDSLINAGFLEVSAKENIRYVMVPTFKIKETYGYIYEFYQYLVQLRKQPTDRYQILNPNDSEIGIQIGYLRNWCGAQVCHADLRNAGYVNDNVTDNYIYELPSIRNKISNNQILSQFVKDFSDYLEFTINMDEIFSDKEPPIYDIPANRSPKSPLEWCKYTVVPYEESDDSKKKKTINIK